jgi:hypothetical protein
VVLPPFSPSLFSLPRLGNGVGGAVAALLVRVEAHASSSCSRVLQQGEEGGERLAVALLQTVEREEQLLGTRKSSPVSASFPLASLFSQKNLPLGSFLSFSKIAPPIAGSSSGIYKQRRRGSPYPCHGAG